MNDEIYNDSIDENLKARLTALVLGEASDFERARLETLLKERPDLMAEFVQLKRLNATLEEMDLDVGDGFLFEKDEEWKLSDERRSELTAVLRGERPQPVLQTTDQMHASEYSRANRRRLKWWSVGVATAACLLLCFGLLHWQTRALRVASFSAGSKFSTAVPSTFELFDSSSVSRGSQDDAIYDAGVNQNTYKRQLDSLRATISSVSEPIQEPTLQNGWVYQELRDVSNGTSQNGRGGKDDASGRDLQAGQSETKLWRSKDNKTLGTVVRGEGVAEYEIQNPTANFGEPAMPSGGGRTSGDIVGGDGLGYGGGGGFGGDAMPESGLSAGRGFGQDDAVQPPSVDIYRYERSSEQENSGAFIPSQLPNSLREVDSAGRRSNTASTEYYDAAASPLAPEPSRAWEWGSIQGGTPQTYAIEDHFGSKQTKSYAASGSSSASPMSTADVANDQTASRFDNSAHAWTDLSLLATQPSAAKPAAMSPTGSAVPPQLPRILLDEEEQKWQTEFSADLDMDGVVATLPQSTLNYDVVKDFDESIAKESDVKLKDAVEGLASDRKAIQLESGAYGFDRESVLATESGRKFEAPFSKNGDLKQENESMFLEQQQSVAMELGKKLAEPSSRTTIAGLPASGLREGNRKNDQSLDELAAANEPFSTFSLHVSDVSFKLAAAALAGGNWPDAAKIRIEEFVNALDYFDPLPTSDERVTCQIEQAIHPFMLQRNVLRISIRTSATGRPQNVPLRLTLLLDNSGSMERADRRQTIRQAFAALAGQMKPNDQVTLIAFANQPRLLAERVSGSQIAELVSLVENLPSEGGTNIEAALNLAMEKASEGITPENAAGLQNRIVLMTDGAVNLGDANPATLSQLVLQMRDAGIAFDAAGISANDLNDTVLEALTRQGDGRYYLLSSADETNSGFAEQIAGALRPAAKNVKVQVEFNPERVGFYKLLGFEKHLLNQEDFRNDKVDAAEMAAAEAGVAMYQFEAKPNGRGDIGSVSVRFQDLASGMMVERRWPIPYDPSPARLDQGSARLRLATTAAMFAAKLRGDALGESIELKSLADILTTLPPNFEAAPRVRQLQTMINAARQISEQ